MSDIPRGLTIWHELDVPRRNVSDEEVVRVNLGAVRGLNMAGNSPDSTAEVLMRQELEESQKGALLEPATAEHFIGLALGLRAHGPGLGLGHNFDTGYIVTSEIARIRREEGIGTHAAIGHTDMPFEAIYAETLGDPDARPDLGFAEMIGRAIGVRKVQVQEGVIA